MTIYGNQVQRSEWSPLRDVVGEVEQTSAGNVVLRIGQENEPGGSWHQTAHVVLTRVEALALAHQIERWAYHRA